MTKEQVMESFSPEPMSGCWLWFRAQNSLGYGNVYYEKRYRPAHRVVYELCKGEILAGLELDHLCRVTCCVNPDHLEPVTHRVNILRGTLLEFNHSRLFKKTHCKNGHELTPENSRYKNGSRACWTCRRKQDLNRYHLRMAAKRELHSK
jgi:hypothetical protein